MKFQVLQKNLNDCLKNVTPFADKGHQLDITKNILVKTLKNLLEVRATNLDVSIIERIQGSCDEEGAIVLPADPINSYIQSLPSETTINLSLKNNKLFLGLSDYNPEFNTFPIDDYPIFPTNKKNKPLLQIKASDLKNALNQTVFATNKDGRQPILNGVFLHVFEGDFYLAATDSYRLAEKKLTKVLKKPTAAQKDLKIIISHNALHSLDRVLSNNLDKTVSLYKEEDEKTILFLIGDGEIEITSVLIDGSYPDYRDLIPQEFATTVIVNKQALADAVKRTILFSKENSYTIILNWQDKNKLNISSGASQIGENNENIQSKTSTTNKEEYSIGFNAKYLQDALQVLEGESIQLNLISKEKPCVLFDLDKKEKPIDDYRHVVMPIRSQS